MPHSDYEAKQKRKKGLKIICHLSEAALAVAAGVLGLTDPSALQLGLCIAAPLASLAKDITDDYSVEFGLMDQYTKAVDDALEKTESYFSHSIGKLKLLKELSYYSKDIDMDLEKVIQKTEAYQTQYMTRQDCKEILAVFETYFGQEVVKYEKLSRYYTIKTGNSTLETLKRIHLMLSADSNKLDQMYSILKETKDDTTQIKAEIHGIKGAIESLKTCIQSCGRFISDVFVQSMIVYFAFTVATVIFDIHTTDALTIYIVVLLSEILLYSPRSNTFVWKVIISSALKQAIFISACSLLVTRQYIENQMVMLIYISGCAIVGVFSKYALLYLKSTHKKNRNGYLQ